MNNEKLFVALVFYGVICFSKFHYLRRPKVAKKQIKELRKSS